jgi:hypothetical protein
LDDPENNFGLDEDEWLLVLSHLSAGMNHLRDNNLVHRFVERLIISYKSIYTSIQS